MSFIFALTNSLSICFISCLLMLYGGSGGVFLTCKVFGEVFDKLFPACAFFKIIFLKQRPACMHKFLSLSQAQSIVCSVSWDDWHCTEYRQKVRSVDLLKLLRTDQDLLVTKGLMDFLGLRDHQGNQVFHVCNHVKTFCSRMFIQHMVFYSPPTCMKKKPLVTCGIFLFT